ncbi:GSCFA domain-containing protein [Flavobacterium lacustre]|uniref:GSCFA domain-containing protein n=1 Tax=Flavobacterium lacustre TaxID=3016339 RepID=UPI0022B6354B|nr:GSCFA domain-containing protein [Flavobacterium lacustre]
MNFRTQIPIPQNLNPIDYNSKIVSLGSCFAVNMAEKFEYYKFQNSVNPFGIIFNPVSIEKLIYRIVNQVFFTEKDIFFHNERWHCFEVHSDLSNANKEEFLENLNVILKRSLIQLFQASHVIITFGTSWVYRNFESNTIVANCHKLPQNQFQKEILSVETIGNSIKNTIDLIQKINPDCNFIFTVSPVRHLKDGFVENQRSKSHLITAIHDAIKPQLPAVNYFSSYEIMMDELRDYRFYAEDMLHPSAVAIDYIWSKFKESTIAESDFPVMEQVDSIQKSLSHKPFNPNSESHFKFESKLKQKMTNLQFQYSFMKF